MLTAWPDVRKWLPNYHASVTQTSSLICPVCWDRDVKTVEGVDLKISRPTEEHPIRQAAVYHCTKFHYFAVFDENLSQG
jgi:hypothetical protein